MQMYMYIEIEIKIKIEMQIKDGYGDAAADHNTAHGGQLFYAAGRAAPDTLVEGVLCVLCVMCCDVNGSSRATERGDLLC